MAGEINKSSRRALSWDDDRSTNKIYASGNVSALGTPSVSRSEVSRVAGNKPVSAPRANSGKARAISLLTVLTNEDISPVLARLYAKLRETDDKQIVYVKNGDAKLLQRVRTSLELAVTRQVITEEMHNDVTLSYTAPAALPPVTVPAITKQVDTLPVEDPLAFMNMDDPDDDDKVDAARVEAVVPTPVDNSADDDDDQDDAE